ncbi:MAG: yycJ [Acidobacteria bacterium]|jgi:ribonuclease BN (tRNA processing enzyme)|nr:yycJ [Acidobacteriota bacterium]
MPPTLCFRSYCSSSAGNCLALWTDDTCVLFDCGIGTLRGCRALLRRHQDRHGPVSALVVSHSHRDHLSAQALKVLGGEGIPIRCHRHVLPQLRTLHGLGAGDGSLLQGFGDGGLTVGEFRITPVALSHWPSVPTFGFLVSAAMGTRRRTVVIATDFHDPSNLLPHLRGADFVFVEANHDLQLLEEHFNPNSRWHLSNVKTAHLLVEAFRDGARAPGNVVLGHLSEKRNEDVLARQEIRRAFARRGLKPEFELETAPKFDASRVIAIGPGPRERAARQGRLF